MQTELSAVLLDYDAVQIRTIWASVILLSIICIAVYAGDRSRKRAEHALAMSEERYRTLVEEASDGIFISDREGRYTDVNPRACTMLGYSRDEILSMTVTDILPSTDVQVRPVRIDELRAGKVLLSERSLIRKDGSLLDVEISARMLPDGRMQGLTRDISARKQAEIALRASENKYRTIVSNIPGGLIHIFDRDFRYVFSAGEELERLGLSNEFLEGKSIHDILSPDMAALVDEQYQRVLRGETVRFEGAFGDDHFSITSGPLRDEAGEVVNILTLSVKITDRKRAEERCGRHAAPADVAPGRGGGGGSRRGGGGGGGGLPPPNSGERLRSLHGGGGAGQHRSGYPPGHRDTGSDRAKSPEASARHAAVPARERRHLRR
ncbi:MAG: PAS domain S-box protein [Ignavibacteria bacterium]|nr:PAS domain S-box protein [Ignavibacteria bacterium]